ncbi:MAG: flavodoxin family protein [Candidatus Pacearchaeota archaeon]|nr:flavodoxin family protein [Candidatus Pacearchaeota archaeon]
MKDRKLVELFKQRQKEALIEAKKIKKHFFEKKIRVLGVSGSMRSKDDCPSEDSTTEWLLLKAISEAKRLGAETKLIKLKEYHIEPCKGCYSTTNTQCHYKCSCYPEGQYGDDMTNKLYDVVSWADVIIFATPIHNFKISSLMSLFLDRLISMDGSLAPADMNNVKNKEINIKHTKWIEKNATDEFGSGFLRRFTGKIAGIIVSGHEVGASLTISSLFMTLNQFGMLFPPFSSIYAINTIQDGLYKDKKKLRNSHYEKEARRLARNLITAAKVLKRKNDYWWVYDGRSN